MDLNKLKVRRSFIFTPGLHPEMFPKAIASGADMVTVAVRRVNITDKKKPILTDYLNPKKIINDYVN